MEVDDATKALSALGQATRLSIFRLLVQAGPGGCLAGDIAGALGIPGATLSFHLKELVAAGLIRGEQLGRNIRYRAEFGAMNALIEFLTHDCCGGDTAACVPTPAASAARPTARRARR